MTKKTQIQAPDPSPAERSPAAKFEIPNCFPEAEAYGWTGAGRIQDADRVGVIRSALSRQDWIGALMAAHKLTDPDLREAMTRSVGAAGIPWLSAEDHENLWAACLSQCRKASLRRRLPCLQYDLLDVAHLFRVGALMLKLTKSGVAPRMIFRYTRARFRCDPDYDARKLPSSVPSIVLRAGYDDANLRLGTYDWPLDEPAPGVALDSDGRTARFVFHLHPGAEVAGHPDLRPLDSDPATRFLTTSAAWPGDPGAEELLRSLERSARLRAESAHGPAWGRILREVYVRAPSGAPLLPTEHPL